MDEAAVRILRAKYLDWCSARIAEQFLDLSPEAIYALARPSSSGAAEAGGDRAAGGESYRVLVQRVTESLLEREPLPPFDEWRASYESSPERYDAEMLGFWRESIDP